MAKARPKAPIHSYKINAILRGLVGRAEIAGMELIHAFRAVEEAKADGGKIPERILELMAEWKKTGKLILDCIPLLEEITKKPAPNPGRTV